MNQSIVVYEGEILITIDADDLAEMTKEELADTIAAIRRANANDDYEDFEFEDDDGPAPEVIRRSDMQ